MKWIEILESPTQDIINFLQSTPAHQKDENGYDFWETVILESRNRNFDDAHLTHLVHVFTNVLNDEKNKISTTRRVSLIFFGIRNSSDTQILARLHWAVNKHEVVDQNGDNILTVALKSSSGRIANWYLNMMKNYLVSLRESDRVAILNSFTSRFPNELSTTVEYINTVVAASREYYLINDANAKPIDKDKILNAFNNFRDIQLPQIALILETKLKDTIFIITQDSMPALVDCLLMLLKNSTRKNLFKFQLVYYQTGHTFYGEVALDKTTNPPNIKIFNCDPALYESNFDYFAPSHLRELAAHANVELYISDELIQKAGGCCHCLAVEGCILLATHSDYGDHYQFMKQHGATSNINGFTVIKGPIHPRLKRSSHVYENETKNTTFFKGIKTTIIDSDEYRNMVVNKHKETAPASVTKDLAQNDGKVVNRRIDRKRDGYREKVAVLLRSDKIQTYGDLKSIIAKRHVTGLQAYCRNQCLEPPSLSP